VSRGGPRPSFSSSALHPFCIMQCAKLRLLFLSLCRAFQPLMYNIDAFKEPKTRRKKVLSLVSCTSATFLLQLVSSKRDSRTRQSALCVDLHASSNGVCKIPAVDHVKA